MLKVVHDQAVLINTYCLWLQITRGDDGEEGDDAGEEGDDDDGNGTSSCSNHNSNDDEKADDLCVPIDNDLRVPHYQLASCPSGIKWPHCIEPGSPTELKVGWGT